MKEEIRLLIVELKAGNEFRERKLNSGELSDYAHTVCVHQYNLTIDFIKSLEKLIL